MRLRRNERGSAAIEMAILMPFFVAMFTAVVVTGRTANVISAVEAAAYDAARTASLERDHVSAQQQATLTVQERLADRGVQCVGGPQVTIPPEPYATAVGERAFVTATVSCQVTYVDVDMVGVPADRTITASFISPLDQYRSRP